MRDGCVCVTAYVRGQAAHQEAGRRMRERSQRLGGMQLLSTFHQPLSTYINFYEPYQISINLYQISINLLPGPSGAKVLRAAGGGGGSTPRGDGGAQRSAQKPRAREGDGHAVDERWCCGRGLALIGVSVCVSVCVCACLRALHIFVDVYMGGIMICSCIVMALSHERDNGQRMRPLHHLCVRESACVSVCV